MERTPMQVTTDSDSPTANSGPCETPPHPRLDQRSERLAHDSATLLLIPRAGLSGLCRLWVGWLGVGLIDQRVVHRRATGAGEAASRQLAALPVPPGLGRSSLVRRAAVRPPGSAGQYVAAPQPGLSRRTPRRGWRQAESLHARSRGSCPPRSWHLPSHGPRRFHAPGA